MLPAGSQQPRMLAGLPYVQDRDAILVAQRVHARKLVSQLNSTPMDQVEERVAMMKELFGDMDPASPPWIEHGFHIDFGCYTSIGSDVYMNSNCTILDCGRVRIGSRCLFATNVQLLGATHPVHYELRNGTKGPEMGAEVTIGDDCWLGSGALILGGVTIGKGCVVGAGSVVTRDVPPFSVVAGNPARVLRTLAEHATPEEIAAHTVPGLADVAP